MPINKHSLTRCQVIDAKPESVERDKGYCGLYLCGASCLCVYIIVLAYRDKAKVLSPKWLREGMKELLEQMINKCH